MQSLSNKCRCCLEESEQTYNIHNNLYMEMFRDALNFLPASDLRLPQGICSGCVNSLHEAKRFRDMVTASEKQLLQTLTDNCVCATVQIKIESCEVTTKAFTTEPVDSVWIKEEAKDEAEGRPDDEVVTLPSSHTEGVDAPLNAEITTPVLNISSQRYFEEESSFDTKRDEHNPPIPLVEDEHEFNAPLYDSINAILKTMVENTNEILNENPSMAQQVDIKQDESESTPSRNLVIVPDVNSMLYNFTKKRRRKHVSPDESGSKRRLTGPTKLRENIILLMLHSTIVPFRHNSNFLNDFICYYCENTYKTMKEVREHTETEHDGKVTDDNIMALMRTRAHKLINADISLIKCRLCNEELKTIDNLIEHLTNIHRKIYHNTGKESLGILGFDLGTDELKCHLCFVKFESFRTLYSHMNEHYEAYSCFCCQKKFANLLRYRTHLKSHVIQEVAEFKCDHCSAVCKSKTGLIYHMKRHHLNISLKCDLCSQTFRFKEYRKRDEHMAEAHGIPKVEQIYTCDICQNGKTYSSKNTLKIHKSNVHKVGNVPRYECKLCDFVTHHTKRMSEHMDIHNGVKNYGCDLCGKRFTKPYTLRVHMRMHLNDKRYACSLCEDAYVHKSMLQYHMKKKHPDSDIIL